MRIVRPAVFAVICLCLAATAPAARRAHAQSLQDGLDLYHKADFDGALRVFDAVAASKSTAASERAKALEYAGLMHVALGKEHYTQAEKDIRAMVQLDPSARPDPEEFPEAYMKIYYKAASASHAFAEAPKPGVTTLAIMDFDNNSIGEDAEKFGAIGRGLSQMLITDLVNVQGLRLVEREKVRYVLDELKLGASGSVDPSTAAKVGRMLGAQALLFGGVMVNGKDMRVSWRLVKVETGEILKASNTDGRAKDFFDVEKKLALGLAENLKVTVTSEAESKIKNTDKVELDAAMAYSEGLKHQDEGNMSAAYQSYEKASKLDPKFAAAKTRMHKIRPQAKVS